MKTGCSHTAIAREHLEEARKGPPPEPSGGAGACRHPDFKLLASQTGREQICVVLSHEVFGNLLQQPRETNAGRGAFPGVLPRQRAGVPSGHCRTAPGHRRSAGWQLLGLLMHLGDGSVALA